MPPVMARIAVSLVFLLNGALFANWVSRIPAVQDALDLNKAQLGLALLGMAVGALIAFPVAGWAIGRFGSKIVTLLGFLLMAGSLPLAALAPSMWLLALALVLVGMGNGATDVAMNAQGVEVEKRYQRPILSSFHASWSLGALLGAAMGGGLAALAINPLPHFVSVGAVFSLLALWAYGHLLKLPPVHSNAPFFAPPPKALWGVGVVVFAAAVGEGAMADWSAVYLRSTLGTSEAVAATGYAAFAVAMLLSRLVGDAMKARLGPANLALSGGVIAAVGLALGLLSSSVPLTLVGFACVGWGLASGFPLAFSAAGNMAGVPQGVALAAIATVGYSGFLLGPPVIGFVAHYSSLQWALGVVVLFAVLMALFSRTLKA